MGRPRTTERIGEPVRQGPPRPVPSAGAPKPRHRGLEEDQAPAQPEHHPARADSDSWTLCCPVSEKGRRVSSSPRQAWARKTWRPGVRVKASGGSCFAGVFLPGTPRVPVRPNSETVFWVEGWNPNREGEIGCPPMG